MGVGIAQGFHGVVIRHAPRREATVPEGVERSGGVAEVSNRRTARTAHPRRETEPVRRRRSRRSTDGFVPGVTSRQDAPMDRRGFFRVALASAGATAMLPSASMAGASTTPRRAGAGPYGAIDGRPPDENGLLLPEGFSSRVARRRRRAGRPTPTTAGTCSPTVPPPSTTATAVGSTCATARSSPPTAPAGRAPSTSTPTARSSTPTGCSRARRPTAPAARRRGAPGSRARSGSTASARCGRSTRPARRRAWRGRPWAAGPTRPWPSTPTTRSCTSPRTTRAASSTASRPTPTPTCPRAGSSAAVVAGDGTVTWAPVADPSAAAAPTPRPGAAGHDVSRQRGRLVPRPHDRVHVEGRQPGPRRSTSRPRRTRCCGTARRAIP